MEIDEVRLRTAWPAALRRFYAETLGLAVADEGEGGFAVSVGTSRLVFQPAEAREGEPVYHLAFNIPENQLAAGKRWLAARAQLLSDPDGTDEFASSDHWNAHMVYFRDSAGNILELIARHALANGSDEAFGPGSLLSVSEVGLVVPDVAGTVAELGRLGLPPYGEPGPAFAPVGDERGLLIVVAEGRGWFPVGEPARSAPMDVTVRGEAGGQLAAPGGGWRVVVHGPA